MAEGKGKVLEENADKGSELEEMEEMGLKENKIEAPAPRILILDQDKVYKERYANGEDKDADGGVPLSASDLLEIF